MDLHKHGWLTSLPTISNPIVSSKGVMLPITTEDDGSALMMSKLKPPMSTALIRDICKRPSLSDGVDKSRITGR